MPDPIHPDTQPRNLFDAEADRDAGQDLALNNAPPPWRETAMGHLLDLVAQGNPFTSEDVTKLAGLPTGEEGPNRNNAVGALIAHASRRGWIARVGDVKARRRSQHAARLSLWQGTAAGRTEHADRAAA